MLVQKLKNFEYYYKKLPLYMRNSYGIKDHFEMIFGMMLQLDINEEAICKCFNLFQDNYEEDIIAKYDDINGYSFKFLDMIGSIYGISRNLVVTYGDIHTETITKNVCLNNHEFYIFIKSKIIQNNYDGSYEQAVKYYKSCGLNIEMFFDLGEPAKCNIYLDIDQASVTENIQALFLSGNLTLKSAGIFYDTLMLNFDKAGIWDAENNHSRWDVSTWI